MTKGVSGKRLITLETHTINAMKRRPFIEHQRPHLWGLLACKNEMQWNQIKKSGKATK